MRYAWVLSSGVPDSVAKLVDPAGGGLNQKIKIYCVLPRDPRRPHRAPLTRETSCGILQLRVLACCDGRLAIHRFSGEPRA